MSVTEYASKVSTAKYTSRGRTQCSNRKRGGIKKNCLKMYYKYDLNYKLTNDLTKMGHVYEFNLFMKCC